MPALQIFNRVGEKSWDVLFQMWEVGHFWELGIWQLFILEFLNSKKPQNYVWGNPKNIQSNSSFPTKN